MSPASCRREYLGGFGSWTSFWSLVFNRSITFAQSFRFLRLLRPLKSSMNTLPFSLAPSCHLTSRLGFVTCPVWPLTEEMEDILMNKLSPPRGIEAKFSTSEYTRGIFPKGVVLRSSSFSWVQTNINLRVVNKRVPSNSPPNRPSNSLALPASRITTPCSCASMTSSVSFGNLEPKPRVDSWH